MTTIEHIRIGPEVGTAQLWPEVAGRLAARLAAHRVAAHETMVLVPFAALIDPLRRALAAGAGWQPRVETPATLAASLGPPARPDPGAPSEDLVLDRLHAERLLRGGARLPPGLPAAFAATQFVDVATALVAEAARHPPGQRAAFRRRVDDELALGAGGVEAALLAAAAAWADSAPPPATDRLFRITPAAWVAVRLGGADRLAESLLSRARVLGLRVDVDAADPPDWPLRDDVMVRRLVADDLEAEATAAASVVLEALAAGAGRVALAVLDRALARRVVALLARRGVEVSDETGWRLSTTPSAARLHARLRAMAADAGPDDWLDWLKSSRLGERQSHALDRLEAHWRAGRRGPGREPSPAVRALWQQIDDHRRPWLGGAPRPLADWLGLLLDQLGSDGDADEWRRGADGQALLRLLERAAAGAPRLGFDFDGFVRWFESACEAVAAEPPLGGAGARVVLAPLARIAGRHFDHVVLPGADEARLGAVEPAGSWLGERRAERLGLPEAAGARRRQRQLALAQLLRVPRLTVLRRRFDDDAPLAPSPDIESLERACLAAGRPLPAEESWQPARVAVAATPVPRPAPHAGGALPERLSASAVEALRECPYRFFSRYALGLSQVEELEAAPGKREYGTWLHEALHRFHRTRSGLDDAGELHAAADQAIDHLDLDRAALLPFRASVETLVPAYLRWLEGHERAGWRWSEAELELDAAPPEWAPQRLRGIVDRVDRGGAGERLIIDYKTGALDGLRRRVAAPLEDTQLAYYAALLLARDGGQDAPLRAAYLALDERDGPVLLEHPGVTASAGELVAALAGELQRIRAGAALPALGEGAVCETCEARGLCRRDHWPAAGAP